MDKRPIQPGLETLPGYDERLVVWNPLMAKGQALCYQFSTGPNDSHTLLIPDACANFLFRCDEGGCDLHISGIQSKPVEIDLAPNSVYFGFKPYCVSGMKKFGADWRELIDVTLEDEESLRTFQTIGDVLAKAKTFDQRSELMRDFAFKRLADRDYIQTIVEFAEYKICYASGRVRVQDVVDQTGYTAQYCRKRFRESMGIAIKGYASIMRFQNAIRGFGRDQEMSDVILENGYCDQSHLTKDFKKYSSMTPNEFLRTYAVA
ncbi:helix-turn-helix domain-containing protein [uncultured Enorma sp.]|uniref:helix-turn-helix domain-containing protein n=1 Tax=uncultured Enorma sp. TaxID=1714346 RepID=UPI00280552D8|nr:helix-turn-helix domain-containing protein [uncultured Enorma sp.]